MFLLYINDLPKAAPDLFSLLYADDTNMLKTSKNIIELQNTINENLSNVTDWLQANQLSINIKKTQFMIWSPKSKELPSIEIVMNNEKIDLVKETKFLGVMVDDKLTWSTHIQQAAGKISRGIGIIKKLRPFLHKKSLIDIYYAFVYPFMTYCIHVWGTAHDVHLSKLSVLQKRAIRIIAGVPPRTHSDPLFHDLRITKFDHLQTLNIAVFMYKYHHFLLPDTFEDLFKTNSQFHSYPTRYSSNICMPICKTDRSKRTIRYEGIPVWNKILNSNIDINVLPHTFKFYIKAALLSGDLSI